MKITIFTSNDLRHINLINKLAKISTKCFAIVEGKTLFPGKVDDFFKKTKLMKKYFANVKHAEKKIFSNYYIIICTLYTRKWFWPFFSKLRRLNGKKTSLKI